MRLLVVIVAATAAGCGGEDPAACQKAVDRFNACIDREGMQIGLKMSFSGECDHAVEVFISDTVDTVDLRAWAEAYLDCTPPAGQCVCPEVGDIHDYQ